jgi:tol-pal system protein YbgF
MASVARRATSRRGLACAALLIGATTLTGCATKKDLRLLREEVVALQLRQDSLFAEMARQNRALQDSVRASNAALQRFQGNVSHQLVTLGQQLVQLQELAGQSQARLGEFRQLLEDQRREMTAAPVTPSGGAAAPDGSAAELYRVGSGLLEQGSAGTARQAFEQILKDFPRDSLAADAQLKLAETYLLEQNFDRGLRELERVVELYPASARAPQALYRAGTVSEQRGNISKAREYFTRVTTAYKSSEEARRAQDKLQKMRR